MNRHWSSPKFLFNFILWICIMFSSVYGQPAISACNCMTDGALAGLVFGCIFATIIVCAIAGLAVWYIKQKRELKDAKVNYHEEGYAAYDNTEFRDENGNADNGLMRTVIPEGERQEKKKRESLLDGILHRRSSKMESTKSTESLNSVHEIIKVPLKSQDFTGLGFNIHGNMRDGIFIKEVLSRGPAKDCGKIHPGDRLLKVTISFEKMVFEDALTILSYASPYAVTAELQKNDAKTTTRRLSQRNSSRSKSNRKVQLHPLFKSHSTDDLVPDKLESMDKENNRHQLVKDSRRTKSVQDYTTPAESAGKQQDGKDQPKLSAVNMESINEEKMEGLSNSARNPTSELETENLSLRNTNTSREAQVLPQAARIRQKEVDPYADLTPEERMEVLRLSYDDPELSQSTPNLSQMPLVVEVLEPLDTAGKVSPEHQKLERAQQAVESDTSDSESLDLVATKQKLQARKALLAKESGKKMLTPTNAGAPEKPNKKYHANLKVPQSANEVTEFRTSAPSKKTQLAHAEPQTSPVPVSPVRSPRTHKVYNGVPAKEKPTLNPAMEKIDRLHPSQQANNRVAEENVSVRAVLSHRTAHQLRAGTNSMPSSEDDHSAKRVSTVIHENGYSLNANSPSSEGTDFDSEQYKKLLYFQQQLAKQHEELTKMGISIPMNLGPLKQGQINGGPIKGEIITNGLH